MPLASVRKCLAGRRSLGTSLENYSGVIIVQPLVSVIMPAYNSEQYIAESIQSVLQQTYENWELLVVDDGSTDNTSDIVNRFATTEIRIKYIFQQNGRQAKARNTGIEKSTGTLIAFLDSDDLWLPDKLERQVTTLVAMNADVVYSNALIIYEPDAAPGATEFPIVAGRVEGKEMLDLLLLQNPMPVQSVLLRMDMFEKAGPFDESVAYHGCEDYELWLKLAAHGATFYGIDQKLVKYRRHPTATTHKNSNWLKPMLRVVLHHIAKGTLDEKKKRTRLRGLYRDVIAALLEEGELTEARAYMKEFSAWDKSGLVTSIQNVLLKVAPRGFNFFSRELLYRTEWHLKRLTGGNG